MYVHLPSMLLQGKIYLSMLTFFPEIILWHHISKAPFHISYDYYEICFHNKEAYTSCLCIWGSEGMCTNDQSYIVKE